jgi:hypothetical protein
MSALAASLAGRIHDALLRRVIFRRRPDFIIGGADDPYLLRWWLIPRNRFFNIYVHKFLRSDDNRALHTHPWAFNASILLLGEYDEVTASGARRLRAGSIKPRIGASPHRVALVNQMPIVTLFITGPVVREWGFLCPQGWRHWREFTSPADAGSIGKGCD